MASLMLMAVLATQALAAQLDWVRQFGTAGLDEMHATAADGSGMYAVGRSEGALPGQGFLGGSDIVSCNVYVVFGPSVSSTRNATLTFTHGAGSA